MPLRGSLISAWAGGPNAQRLSGRNEAELACAALDSLQSMFGRKVRVRTMLERAYLHDWQADPFARGAYSYVIAGGTGARKALAAPVQNTLFFAGEAADTEGESGTVAGRIAERDARRTAGAAASKRRYSDVDAAHLRSSSHRRR